MMLAIPLHDRSGAVLAHALVDDVDRHLASFRWSLAGGRDTTGRYAARRSGGTTVYLHRVILGLEPGDPRMGDHRNLDKLDCRRANLRIVTRAQNAQNVPARPGTSRHRGVCFDKARGLWNAEVQVGGFRHTGRFATEDEAAAAAAAWRSDLMTHA